MTLTRLSRLLLVALAAMLCCVLVAVLYADCSTPQLSLTRGPQTPLCGACYAELAAQIRDIVDTEAVAMRLWYGAPDDLDESDAFSRKRMSVLEELLPEIYSVVSSRLCEKPTHSPSSATAERSDIEICADIALLIAALEEEERPDLALKGSAIALLTAQRLSTYGHSGLGQAARIHGRATDSALEAIGRCAEDSALCEFLKKLPSLASVGIDATVFQDFFDAEVQYLQKVDSGAVSRVGETTVTWGRRLLLRPNCTLNQISVAARTLSELSSADYSQAVASAKKLVAEFAPLSRVSKEYHSSSMIGLLGIPQRWCRMRTEIDALLILVAIRRWDLGQNGVLESLNALVPVYLEAIPQGSYGGEVKLGPDRRSVLFDLEALGVPGSNPVLRTSWSL